MVSAADLGLGLTLTNSNYNYDGNGEYSFGSNAFTLALTGAIGLDNGLEIDPYVSYYGYTENDADEVSDSYIDEYEYSLYTFGTDLFFTRSVGEDFRLLGGFGASLGFGSRDYPDAAADYSGLVIQLYAPVAAELKVTPNFGLRVGARLATFTSSTVTFDYSDYDIENKVQETDFALVPSNLSFGAFFFL